MLSTRRKRARSRRKLPPQVRLLPSLTPRRRSRSPRKRPRLNPRKRSPRSLSPRNRSLSLRMSSPRKRLRVTMLLRLSRRARSPRTRPPSLKASSSPNPGKNLKRPPTRSSRVRALDLLTTPVTAPTGLML